VLYEPINSILRNNLTDTTSVTFNGKAENFTVVSGTEAKTTVPTGATTGTVEVTTSKKIKSNVVFLVTK
jgi:spore coat protein U-like protein